MKILTSREMKDIDRTAIETLGIPGPVLMENAGIRVVRALRRRFPRLEAQRIVVVAGKGNNGGDGFVVARHLHNMGARPDVILFASKEEVKGDAAVNLGILLRMGLPIIEVRTAAELRKVRSKIERATVLIDALFGTGLAKPLDGLFAAAVADINRSAAFKVAIDIPSGLSADTFEVIGPAVKADLTVAFAAPKIAHIFPPASELVGELVVAPIGIPPSLFDRPDLSLGLIEAPSVRSRFGPRRRDAHKGSFGHVLVVAGSLGKTGAAALAGKAALRMGAGLVTVATAATALPIVARSMPELMTEPLPETPEGTIAEEAVGKVVGLLKGKSALCLGPGLSTHPSTARFVLSLLPKVKVPCVIDADGLNIIAGKMDTLETLRAPAVLTPHPGEFGRLVGQEAADVLRHRLEVVPEFARRYQKVVVLKGYRTLVATPDGRMFVNPTGNPGMATGGTGDVLSGLIASEIAQDGKDLAQAVLSAVFVHGLAGDLAARKLGERAMTAGDIIRHLAPALKALSSEGGG